MLLENLVETDEHVLMALNPRTKDQGPMTQEQITSEALLIALQNLYVWMAEYYPSSVNNSPAMKAAELFLRLADELHDEEEREG